MVRHCNFCKGELIEIDNIGTEECELCGTVYRLLPPMEKEDEST